MEGNSVSSGGRQVGKEFEEEREEGHVKGRGRKRLHRGPHPPALPQRTHGEAPQGDGERTAQEGYVTIHGQGRAQGGPREEQRYQGEPDLAVASDRPGRQGRDEPPRPLEDAQVHQGCQPTPGDGWRRRGCPPGYWTLRGDRQRISRWRCMRRRLLLRLR